MKLLLSLGMALGAMASAQAQVFRPQMSGGHGAPAGPAPAAHVTAGPRAHSDHAFRPRYVAVPYRGYGYSRYYSSPVYGYYDGYWPYDYPYYGVTGYGGYYGGGSAASNGLLLGALAGGIIGNNSGEFRHSGWRGAAWGAGLGWLLGAVVDANRRPVTYAYPNVASVVPAASAAPVAPAPAATTAQPVTIINNYYGNAAPMSGANALFGR